MTPGKKLCQIAEEHAALYANQAPTVRIHITSAFLAGAQLAIEEAAAIMFKNSQNKELTWHECWDRTWLEIRQIGED